MDAKKDCRASGGYLVKIDDGDEQHFITFKQSKSYRVSLHISLHVPIPFSSIAF